MRLAKRLWNDEAGFVFSMELILVATILVLGLIVGLTTVQDQIVQELGDTAQAIANVNQSYLYFGVTGHSSATAGSEFLDNTDFCDDNADPAAAEPACIILQEGPSLEGAQPSPLNF